MAAPNPLSHAPQHGGSTISKEQFCIAGIQTTVYGLEQIPPEAERPLANEDWRHGNKKHAQDLFSIYHGTAVDTSLLLDHLASYIFPDARRRIVINMVMGISLGGHAAWQCLVREPRITVGVVGIGCPDYLRLMDHRAGKSRLNSWTNALESGVPFIGSSDFPQTLVEAVTRWDPASLLMDGDHGMAAAHQSSIPEARFQGYQLIARNRLGGKKILSLSGGADKLVPYSCSFPFLQFLKAVTGTNPGIEIVDRVFDGVGHEMSTEMIEEAKQFVYTQLKKAEQGGQIDACILA